MKTAEDWAKHIVGWMLPETEWEEFHNDPTDSDGLLSIIKQIQDDALKAAAEIAAIEYAEALSNGCDAHGSHQRSIAGILSARDRKESL